ncbi:SPFH and helix-turn-helix domain-containing protein [Hydrogenophaga sp. SL48]|jgi:excisionase family DNA binding protein|uniref:SPFH and helix-turn-helix domain-containing protein n=1 Tax=Hydrogenophaga sp. SL48 TaxID=2806347 RepID=UPI001F45F515|nr:SPFH and helix-turn-helix domain-containing protein [Hydrogenophaga sp. SL48]UJW80765.1 SPFH domain-containing protein [Hydrogenophaga sp. SL48]
MAIMDFLNRQFIDVIEWVDDSRDTLSYRFPDDDKQIKNEAQLIVRESQIAQFVYVGQFADTLGPGKHTLKTENIPILGDLLGWKYKFQTPFKADVYYVITRVFTGNKWGTSNPVMLRDADFGVVRVRAFGTYDFKIVDAVKFLKEVAGTDHHFRLDEFNDVMRSRIVSVFSETLAKAQVPALDVATRYSELGDALLAPLNEAMREKYGLEMTSFVVENVSVPPELEQAIDKRGAMTAIGNLNDYVKYNMGNALAEGKAGTAGIGAELAAGLAMGQSMMQGGMGGAPAASQPGMVPQAPVATTAPAAPPIALMTPEQVAEALGVSPADVLQELEAGNLKGRKIGSQWRVPQASLDEFLKG